MKRRRAKLAAIASAALLAVSFSTTLSAETPKKGGVLKFVVPDEPPSFDGHRETTFALIHPIAPFYSVLIRVDPQNPASTTDFVCDLCTEMPKPTDGGKTWSKINDDGYNVCRKAKHGKLVLLAGNGGKIGILRP